MGDRSASIDFPLPGRDIEATTHSSSFGGHTEGPVRLIGVRFSLADEQSAIIHAKRHRMLVLDLQRFVTPGVNWDLWGTCSWS